MFASLPATMPTVTNVTGSSVSETAAELAGSIANGSHHLAIGLLTNIRMFAALLHDFCSLRDES